MEPAPIRQPHWIQRAPPSPSSPPTVLQRRRSPRPSTMQRPRRPPGTPTSRRARAAKPATSAAATKPGAKPPATPAARFRPELEDKLGAQAARGLVAALRQGGGSVTIRLQPGALGDLKIKVDLAAGRVGASFEV